MTCDKALDREAKRLSDYIDAEGLKRAKMCASESEQSQPGDVGQVRVVFDPRPTPISLAVHMHLANLERQPCDVELNCGTYQPLSCIQNLRSHMQLLDDQLFEATILGLLDKPQKRQGASSLPLAELKRVDVMPSRLSSTRNLSSKPLRGKGKV